MKHGCLTDRDTESVVKMSTSFTCQASPALEGAQALERGWLSAMGERNHDIPDDYIECLSPPMRALTAGMARVAAVRVPILLCGETGTGKSTLARAIHEHSPAPHTPFSVVESAVATAETISAIPSTTQHTVLLEEIGDLPPAAQKTLVRLMDASPAGPRFISTTSRDLKDLISRQVLHADLLYRLDVVRLDIPPLRLRPDDIVPLAEHFLALVNRWLRRDAYSLSLEAHTRLLRHEWAGNVRELRNCMIESALGSKRPLLGYAELKLRNADRAADPEAELLRALSRLHAADSSALYARTECAVLRWALQNADHNRVRAAATLGISRGSLRAKLKRHGLEVGIVLPR